MTTNAHRIPPAIPTPAKAPWVKTTVFQKGKVFYHGTRNSFSGSIERTGLLYQRGLSLETVEQLELLLLAEGYQEI